MNFSFRSVSRFAFAPGTRFFAKRAVMARATHEKKSKKKKKNLKKKKKKKKKKFKGAKLRIVIDSAMTVVDEAPATNIGLFEFRKRWQKIQSRGRDYMFANRIRRSLQDIERVSDGYKSQKMALNRKLAISMQLLLPTFWLTRYFSRSAFAKQSRDLYAQYLQAHALGDESTLKRVCVDKLARSASKEVKKRNLPRHLQVEWSGELRKASIVQVRVVMNPDPFMEFGQVKVRLLGTQTVQVRDTRNNELAGEPQERPINDLVAFERDLLKKEGTWKILQKIKEEGEAP